MIYANLFLLLSSDICQIYERRFWGLSDLIKYNDIWNIKKSALIKNNNYLNDFGHSNFKMIILNVY